MSVLTRKIPLLIFGIATFGCTIGGTIWFDNHQSDTPLTNAVSNTSTFSKSIAVLQNATPSNDVRCSSTDIEVLNLFFRKDTFRFAENEAQQTYFKGLTAYLQHKPTVKLSIIALRKAMRVFRKLLVSS